MTSAFTLLGILAGVAASITGGIALVRKLAVTVTRVNETTAAHLLTVINRDPAVRKWYYQAHFTVDNAPPEATVILAWIPNVGLVRLNWSVVLLTAGNVGKEPRCFIEHTRFAAKRVWKYLEAIEYDRVMDRRLPVDIVGKWANSRLGFVRPGALPPRQPKEVWAAAERDVEETATGNRERVGIIVHGEPGSGKSSFVRWLATKHRLPVKIIALSPDMTNIEVLLRLSNLPDKCIVLLEDFDTVFHGRVPQFGKETNFTFDAVLNAIDGVHSRNSGQVWVITANDLSKLDSALTDRPGRFRHVLYFGPVNGETSDQYFSRQGQ